MSVVVLIYVSVAIIFMTLKIITQNYAPATSDLKESHDSQSEQFAITAHLSFHSR